MDKREAIEAGTRAGEVIVRRVLRNSGLASIANTIRLTDSYAGRFRLLWDGGDDNWHAFSYGSKLHAQHGVSTHFQRPFDLAFARAARRFSEEIVRRYLDAKQAESEGEMITSDPDKQDAMQKGETAGEEYALEILKTRGIKALADTLSPRPHENTDGFCDAFFELWEGSGEKNGDEFWGDHVIGENLAAKAQVHPYPIRAFDFRFVKGARRCAEMVVRGFIEARAGVDFDAPQGETEEDLKKRLDWTVRRTRLGRRPALTAAYEAGFKLYKSQAGE